MSWLYVLYITLAIISLIGNAVYICWWIVEYQKRKQGK